MIDESYHDTRNVTPTALSEDYARMIFEESGVAPEVAAERGYWTATKRSELDMVPRYQRRVRSLVIPMYSPDGKTVRHQLRPDKPRVRNGKTVKYETPGGTRSILDIHPRMKEAAAGDGDLWITEGIKKADALTSRDLCTVGLIGVWNWQKDGELLPDWEYIALAGRNVYVVFDSDVMVKDEVQLALERLVGALEARSAVVKVVYLPDTQDGVKVGVDDYLVAGGTVEDLYELAHPFEKSEYTKIRLSRSDRLRAAVVGLWAWHEAMPMARDTECVRRAVFRAHMAAAAHRGRPGQGRSVSYYLSSEEGAIAASTSQPTFSKHTRALEEAGVLHIQRFKDKAKANRYTLSPPVGFGNNNSNRVAQQGNVSKENKREDKGSTQGDDHRYSQIRPDRGQVEVPEARWSRVIVSWHMDELGRRVCDVDPLLRLGPKRREVMVHLLGRGGEASVSDLMARFASPNARSKDFVYDTLGPMFRDFSLIEVEDGRVALREDWREALDNARMVGQEQEARDRQIVNYELKRAAFHDRDKVKPDRAPTEAEMDARRKGREAMREEADEVFEDLELVKDSAPDDQDQEPAVEGSDSVPDHREPVLSGEDRQILEAIRAYELKFGPGSFRWDVASCKAMFYQVPGGCWPTPAELDRIRLYLAAAEEVAA